jgi:hypothetical protein
MEEPLVHAQLPVGSEADVNQPDLSTLRAAVANRAHRVLDRAGRDRWTEQRGQRWRMPKRG